MWWLVHRSCALSTSRFCSLLCLAVFFSSGCSIWQPEKEAPDLSLPAPQPPIDAVLVDVQFLRIPIDQSDQLSQLWNATDEQVIPINTRRALESNGLRIGLIPGNLPPIVQQWTTEAEQRMREDTLEQANVAADTSLAPKRLTCRAGKRKELLLRAEPGVMTSVIFKEDGQLRGGTFDSPEYLFDLRAVPHGDGSATINLTPEIKHGQIRNRYVGRESAFRFDWQREQKKWESLAIQLRVQPGQCLVITSTDPPHSLGQHMFLSKTVHGAIERVVLLVRMGQSQLDELFAPESVSAAERAAQN